MNKYTFGAASTNEKNQKGCFINQCESFKRIVFEAENAENMVMEGDKLTFTCDDFRVLPDESSVLWQQVFKYTRTNRTITITVPGGYSMGFPISVPR